MKKKIFIIGTLDTKGDQIEYLKNRIEERGIQTSVIDVGVMGDAPFEPSVTHHQVAEAAGMTLEEIKALGHESLGIAKMTEGACKIMKDMVEYSYFDGVFALGGSMGTALALEVMATLPLGMPKVILSTIAYSPAIDPDLLSNNILMMPWVGGLWGINEIAKIALDQAAGSISGMAQAYQKDRIAGKKVVGVTSLGMAAARYLYHLRPALQEKGYEIAAFHATGMNTRIFEKGIRDGMFDFVLDLFAGEEIIHEICGSLFNPGPHRLEAAAEVGTPQIVSLGLQDMILWGPHKPIPEKYRNRDILQHNPLLWMIFTSREEKMEMARLLAKKLNAATGPTAVILPLKFSLALTKYGKEEYLDHDAYRALREELRKNLKPEIRYVEVDASTDDKEFSDAVISLMTEMTE